MKLTSTIAIGLAVMLPAIPAAAQHVSDQRVHGPVKYLPHHHRKRCQVKYVEHHRVKKCRFY